MFRHGFCDQCIRNPQFAEIADQKSAKMTMAYNGYTAPTATSEIHLLQLPSYFASYDSSKFAAFQRL